ncbi:carbohydrate kinase [Acidisoma cellulosilytica]|uniref:Carbohydrate kinase n=1 Tax=Acidisoma cellulosilyticum TaxID=2802395 RepID=A0A963Z2C4_9PROT|nr:FGGY-family carbohydrate kinase [Acidisoma cellulosilyticum]MCB8881231.1 carbohydrate kinase [Acidisoma cellulosilyticum]
MTTYLLGIDIGTSIVKAAVFDRDGQEVASATRQTIVLSPQPAWAEADPAEVWAATCDVIGRVLARVPTESIAAIGLSGAMVGAWVVDEQGHVLRPGIFWSDGRAQPLIDAMIAQDPALMSRIFAESGSAMQQGCTLPVLAHLARHEPEILARAAAVIGAKDFIRAQLTGRIATDIVEAAVAPGNARARGRSPSLIALFGLQDWAHLLPEPQACESIAGFVTEAAARATGLSAGTPVAIGAGDVAASVIGAGGLAEGAAVSILGTTCLNGVAVSAPVFTPPDLGILFTLPGGLWLRSMVNVAGTVNIDWALAALCPDFVEAKDAYDRMADIARQSPPGAQGAVYIPYLSEVGIIAPVLAPSARGGFAGLTARHRRPDLLRAVYEGVAYAIRDCFVATGLDFGTVRLVGGGARSAFWRQMIADVLNRRVEVPMGQEFGAKGAALLAGTAIGWYPSIPEASAACCRILHRHDPAGDGRYELGFARYRTYAGALAEAKPPNEQRLLS